jgi:outer membrane protein assembly factor BamE (lipoprotein component of BamABCDE complex)
MRKVSLLLILSLLVGMAGCATATRELGNEKLALLTQEEINQRIVKGKTTKEDVLEWLGPPTRTAVRSTSYEPEMWLYGYLQDTVTDTFTGRKATRQMKRLRIVFKNDGVVSRFMFDDGNIPGRKDIR